MSPRNVSRYAPKLVGMENLEDKMMLAGDVSIAILDGNIVVRGDAEANAVEVRVDATNDRLLVRGLTGADGELTTLNGQSEPVVIPTAMGNLQINMGAGDDMVRVPGGALRNLGIQLGPGDDVLRLGGANDTTTPNLLVTENLRIHASAGDDFVIASGVNVGNNAFVGGGVGDDVIQLRQVNANSAVVAGRAGADRIGVQNSNIDNLRIFGGRAADRVSVVDSAFSNLNVNLGAGDDFLEVGGNTVDNLALLRGGQGFDHLHRVAPNDVEHYAVVGFEMVTPYVDDADDVPHADENEMLVQL